MGTTLYHGSMKLRLISSDIKPMKQCIDHEQNYLEWEDSETYFLG